MVVCQPELCACTHAAAGHVHMHMQTHVHACMHACVRALAPVLWRGAADILDGRHARDDVGHAAAQQRRDGEVVGAAAIRKRRQQAAEVGLVPVPACMRNGCQAGSGTAAGRAPGGGLPSRPTQQLQTACRCRRHVQQQVPPRLQRPPNTQPWLLTTVPLSRSARARVSRLV